MNGTGKQRRRRAKSVPVYAVIDKDGNQQLILYMTAESAARAAQGMWPWQQQDPDHTGKGWDIKEVRATI